MNLENIYNAIVNENYDNLAKEISPNHSRNDFTIIIKYLLNKDIPLEKFDLLIESFVLRNENDTPEELLELIEKEVLKYNSDPDKLIKILTTLSDQSHETSYILFEVAKLLVKNHPNKFRNFINNNNKVLVILIDNLIKNASNSDLNHLESILNLASKESLNVVAKNSDILLTLGLEIEYGNKKELDTLLKFLHKKCPNLVKNRIKLTISSLKEFSKESEAVKKIISIINSYSSTSYLSRTNPVLIQLHVLTRCLPYINPTQCKKIEQYCNKLDINCPPEIVSHGRKQIIEKATSVAKKSKIENKQYKSIKL